MNKELDIAVSQTLWNNKIICEQINKKGIWQDRNKNGFNVIQKKKTMRIKKKTERSDLKYLPKFKKVKYIKIKLTQHP